MDMNKILMEMNKMKNLVDEILSQKRSLEAIAKKMELSGAEQAQLDLLNQLEEIIKQD